MRAKVRRFLLREGQEANLSRSVRTSLAKGFVVFLVPASLWIAQDKAKAIGAAIGLDRL